METLRTKLNDTELAVAKLMAQGYTNAEIAEQLHYSYNYVKRWDPSSLTSWAFPGAMRLGEFLM